MRKAGSSHDTQVEKKIIVSGSLNPEKEVQDRVGYEKYDVVVANILADVIIPLAEIADEFMKPGALFISSGIIYLKAEAVKEATIREAEGQAEALRLGIARALCAINAEYRPALKAAGFLTRDSREVERKKPGQPGARRRFQFSKR